MCLCKFGFLAAMSVIWNVITCIVIHWYHHNGRIYCLLPEVKIKWRFRQHIDCVWNMMEHARKQDFVFRRNGRVHLNRQGRQVSRLLADELCASAVVMVDTPCSEVVWKVLAIHSIRQFPLHFSSRASPCAITFQLESTSESLHPNYKSSQHSCPP